MATKPIYFWRETAGDSPWLSQWYPSPFYDDQDDTIIYKTAEHYMMYQKAILFNDTKIANQVLNASHPSRVKTLGRKVSNFSHEVWDANREEIVYKGNLLKFTKPFVDDGDGDGSNNDLLSKLLETGDRELVEASPYDQIWGIGFKDVDAEANRQKWGLNLLGKALVKVRAVLREQQGATEDSSDA